MQVSLPSRRRAARFLVVFYAATALLFFGFHAVVFGPFSLLTLWGSVLWPMLVAVNELAVALVLLGLFAALVEPRVMEVGS